MERKSFSLQKLFFFCALLLCLAGCPSRLSTPEAGPSPVAPTPPSTPTPRSTATPRQRPFEVSLRDEGVVVDLPWEGGELHRSFSPVRMGARENRAQLTIDGRQALDPEVPDGVVVHYLARKPGQPDRHAQIAIPPKALPPLSSPRLEIDKLAYCLRVVDGHRVVKRYPVALGGDPINRKFCQDMKSTPEGSYQVYNLQPDATYFKALDLDYPRPIDHARHQLAIEADKIEATRPIGGEIQIHGWGIAGNWTAGCIALRDEDMTELFDDPAIRAGIEVFITGSQFRESDRDWLKSPPADSVRKVQNVLSEAGYYQGAIDGEFGSGTALALGRYQRKEGLPDSCQLDLETREHFGL